MSKGLLRKLVLTGLVAGGIVGVGACRNNRMEEGAQRPGETPAESPTATQQELGMGDAGIGGSGPTESEVGVPQTEYGTDAGIGGSGSETGTGTMTEPETGTGTGTQQVPEQPLGGYDAGSATERGTYP